MWGRHSQNFTQWNPLQQVFRLHKVKIDWHKGKMWLTAEATAELATWVRTMWQPEIQYIGELNGHLVKPSMRRSKT